MTPLGHPMPRPGEPAPSFDLPAATGGRVSLERLRGRTVLLFFLPKASTPG